MKENIRTGLEGCVTLTTVSPGTVTVSHSQLLDSQPGTAGSPATLEDLRTVCTSGGKVTAGMMPDVRYLASLCVLSEMYGKMNLLTCDACHKL